MRTPSVTPINLPCDFRIDEMFFSTTDPRGVIQSGNSVFAWVSGYSMEELVGQPHNIIRHPDMPRVVFRLLWDHLHRDLPVAALVKNMNKVGHYYWVIALVTPVPGGYLSVRFKPSSSVSTKVQEIYGRLRAIEADHGNNAAGMDAAGTALACELNQLGFADYGALMWKLLHDEMKSRDSLTGGLGAGRPVGAAASGTGGTVAVLRSIGDGAARAYVRINTLYDRLDELTSLHEGLSGKSTFVLDLAHSIRFVALSTAIKAAKLGNEGNGLGVIAQFLNDASAQTSSEVRRLTDAIKAITGELHAVIFNLAGARLQLEMMILFARELMEEETGAGAGHEQIGVSRQGMIGGLQQAFQLTMARAVSCLGSLGKHLSGLGIVADDLRRTVLTLHVAQVGGKIEASRIKHDDSIMAVLLEIHAHIENTARELGELNDITGRFAQLIGSVPAMARAIEQVDQQIERDVGELSLERIALARDPSDDLRREDAARDPVLVG